MAKQGKKTRKDKRQKENCGSCRKTYGSLKVISGYSQPKATPRLSYHHLSLHTQAQETFINHPPNFPAFAGPPLAMRESRAPAQSGDSGNQHALNPSHLSQTPSPKKKRRKMHAHNANTSDCDLSRKKCRSSHARLSRKVRRAYKRTLQRQLFRRIRSKAQDLASQLPAYTAQDPRRISSNYTFSMHENICSAQSKPSASIKEHPSPLRDSDYQELVQENNFPLNLRIASLNCRGLSSIFEKGKSGSPYGQA